MREMTNHEAAEKIGKDICTSKYCNDSCMYGNNICPYDMAKTALKEIQQYRQIGTVEECKEAGEKRKVKPLEFYGDGEDGKLLCPNCGEDLWELKECGFNNCPYCGQAINYNLEETE